MFLPLVAKRFPSFDGFGVGLFGSGGLEEMAAAGATWARQGLVVKWSLVEPAEGERDWSALADLEGHLLNLASADVRPILIVSGTPEWAKNEDGGCCGPVKADKLPAFGSFVHDLVERYGAPPFGVKYWELWNEPDVDPSLLAPDVRLRWEPWGDVDDAYYGGGTYAEMLKAVYPRAKAADPEAQVMVGGLLLDCDPSESQSCTAAHGVKPSRFLEGILRNGGRAYFDGVSYHAYDYYWGSLGKYGNVNWRTAWNTTGPVSIPKARFLKNVLAEYGASGKFVMNTESAILCDGGCDDVFESTKAYYVAQVYAAAVAESLRANLWYCVFGWRNSALLNEDLSPRPAYTAFGVSQERLRGALHLREITAYAGVKGYEFDLGTRRLWVLWSLDGRTHTVDLSTAPTAIYDALGASIPATRSVATALKPLYVEWGP